MGLQKEARHSRTEGTEQSFPLGWAYLSTRAKIPGQVQIFNQGLEFLSPLKTHSLSLSSRKKIEKK